MTLAIAAGATARAARSSDIQLRLAGVSITDGSTALTRMCWGRSSSARISDEPHDRRLAGGVHDRRGPGDRGLRAHHHDRPARR